MLEPAGPKVAIRLVTQPDHPIGRAKTSPVLTSRTAPGGTATVSAANSTTPGVELGPQHGASANG